MKGSAMPSKKIYCGKCEFGNCWKCRENEAWSRVKVVEPRSTPKRNGG